METGEDGSVAPRKDKFKSYYVVWKLFCAPVINGIFFAFKSYYVVWKLISDIIFWTSTSCLNRTM